jgi:hypothetical protein
MSRELDRERDGWAQLDAEQRMDAGYQTWMAKVNAITERLVGCAVEDLADCCYRDWYEDDVTPMSAARRAIRESGS